MTSSRPLDGSRPWAATLAALIACAWTAACAVAPEALAHEGHRHRAGSELGTKARTSIELGPVQPLRGGDWHALYGESAQRERRLATSARLAYRRRGCRIARSRAKYYNNGIRTFTIFFDSRFCWDRRRKRAVQRGYQESHSDVSRAGSLVGLKVDDGAPLKAFSQRWHGGRKGMTHMNVRFDEEVCVAKVLPFCDDYKVFLSIHGHYDGTAYDHQYTIEN